MKLKNAARYFDDDTVLDAYTGTSLFKAQFSSYDSSKPDGSFERRRTVSVAPEVAFPTRRVVKVQGDRWLLSTPMLDTFKDRPIRQTASAKLADASFDILTPGQAALRASTGYSTAYAFIRYTRDNTDTSSDSEYDPFFEVTFAISEVIPDGAFLRSTDRYLHVRSVAPEIEGYWLARSDELARKISGAWAEPTEVDILIGGAVDPITELPAAGVSTTGIMLDMYKLYQYDTEADKTATAGDKTLIIAKSSATPKAGQDVTINSVRWKIAGFTSFYDAWNLYLKRS